MAFDPFASGLAVSGSSLPVDLSRFDLNRPSSEFNPFSDGGATAAKPGGSLPAGEDSMGHWRNLYDGLDGIDKRADDSQRAAFAQLDKVEKDPKDARARAVNQAFVSDSYGLHGPWVQNNWEAVKLAIADREFGDKNGAVDERWLYGKIAERLGAGGGGERFVQSELKAWTWRDTAGRAGSSFWTSINKPIIELASPPENLPDVWLPGPVPTNPAVFAGLYKGAVKPLVESLESPLGIAALGAASVLKGMAAEVPAAKVALTGMSVAFASLMGYSTAKAAPEAIRVAMNPNASTQEKVEALSGVAGSATMTVLGALGTAFDLLPDKGAAAGKKVVGKTPSQAAEILRREAVSAAPEAADALNRAATTLDEVGAYERGPDAWQAKPPTGERIAAAAARHPDGSVVEGESHEQIHAENAPDLIESLPPAARAIVEKAEEVGLNADVTDSGAMKATPVRAALEQFEGSGEIETVGDLVDRIEELVESGKAPESLRNAVETYREMAKEDFEEYAGRSDVEAAENAFVDAVRAVSGPDTSVPKAALYPEVTDTGEGDVPTRFAGTRWTPNRGSVPGEPIAWLDVEEDGDPETAKAAIVEVEVAGKGVLYEVRSSEGELIAMESTAEEAAKIAEAHFTPEAEPAPRVDTSSVRNAKTREDMVTAGGKLIMAATSREEIAAIKVAMQEWKSPDVEEGFVTTAGRFVSRDEARVIAEESGQIKNQTLPPPEGKQPTEITPKVETPKAASKPLHSHEVEMDPVPDFSRSSFGQTSLKNAYGELERVAYGFDEAPVSEKRSMAERWTRAGEVLAENPEAGRLLAERLLKNPNLGLTDDQSALLLRHKVGLQSALNEAADAASDPNSSPELKKEAGRQVDELSDQLLKFLDAVNRRGSEWGREGRWRQAIAREDYSFAAQETLLRAAKGGAELTDGDRGRLMSRVKELESAQARYEAKIAELQTVPREQAVESAVRAMSKPPMGPRRFKGAEAIREKLHAKAEESKKFLFASGRLFAAGPDTLYHLSVIGADRLYSTGLDFAEWSAAMVKELGEKARPFLAEAWDASKKLFHAENKGAIIDELRSLSPEDRTRRIGPFAQELARAKIEQGIKDRDSVVDAVWTDIKEAVPEITRRETMDAISGYGRFKPLSHDQITDKLRDLKGQLQQVAKLEDMAKGEAPKKTGVERRTPSDEERRLQQQVEAKKKEGGYAITDPERQLRTALQSVKRNLENRIKDLTREFETGEGRTKGATPPSDPRAEALKALRDRIKETVDAVEEHPEMTPEERISKAVESTSAAIERLEKQLNDGKVFPDPAKTSEPWSPALSKLKAQLEDLRDFRKEMQRLARPPKSPQERALAVVKSNLKRQIDALEKQIASGEKIPKAKRSVALDSEAEALKARRDELKGDFERVFGRPQLSDEQRLNIWKAGAARRIAEWQERLANKDFEPKPKKPLPLDKEAFELKAKVERIKQDFWIERARAEEAGRPTWQKALKTTAALARASALSGYHTLGKLATFSLARFSEAPIYEGVSAILRRLPGVDSVAAKANLEAGSEFSGLAKFYAKAATAGARDALETLKTGKSGLKAELADARTNAEPIHWYDYFGILHMAEKSPLLRADFELRLEKATQWAITNGMDVEDPMVAAALRKDAFDYSQRSILQENNSLSSAINAFTRQLEAENPKTGKVDVTKATLSWFVKTFLTKGIVRTPANYVAQTIARTPVGLAKGTAQLFVAHAQGIDKLTPEEANTIMRLLKVGAVGSAVFVWGAIDASKDPKDRIFGGYYQPGEKRSEDDVGFGRIRAGGIEFPHILTHNPLTEAGQMGSTFYRVMKARLPKSKGGEERGVVAGAAASLAALASEAPIVSPITREVQMAERGEVNKLVWDEVAGLIPMFLQNLASDMDNGRSRRPETFEQAVELGVPGMRDNVPETKAQKKRDIRERLKQ